MTTSIYYTYSINDCQNNKSYIGYRHCNCKPEEDLGIHYFSSSKDKDFINLQSEHPEYFNYQILGIFENKKDAINDEIYLHELYNVGINPNFYNRAKQTSSKFDTTGCVVIHNTLTQKEKLWDKNTPLPENYELGVSDKTRLKRKSIVRTKEWCENISKSSKGKVISIEDRIKMSIAHGSSEEKWYKKHIESKKREKDLKSRYKKYDHEKEEMSKRLKENHHNRGKKWMMFGDKTTLVSEVDFEKFLNEGWIFGRPNYNKPRYGNANPMFNRKHIFNPSTNESKAIPNDKPIPDGWELGLLKK